MNIYTKRLELIPISYDDRYDIFKYFDDEVTTYMYPKPATNISETDAFIKISMQNYELGKDIVYVARLKDTHEFIGCMGVHELNTKTPELGIWIKKQAHHYGFGLEGIKAIYHEIEKSHTYDYLIYPVDYKNRPSRNIAESLGGIPLKRFNKENQKGVILDIIEYHLYKEIPEDIKKPIILFQGDSITDANRAYDHPPYGHGYVNELTKHITQAIIINKGISGNRTTELLERWDLDAISIKPDFISILVGINEVWHKYKWNKPMTTHQYKENYIKLLELMKKSNPNTKILLIEPFVYPIGAYESTWDNDLAEEQKMVKELAATYANYYIPMQHILNQYLQKYKMKDILDDGVHPTLLGHQLIEKEVRKVVKDFLIDYYVK